MTRLAALLLALLVAAGAAAHETRLALDGPLVQGGLVTGRAAPGTRVSLDGGPVRVSSDGLFLIGFGRDAGPAATLKVAWPDGTVERRTLHVKARSYEVQRIDGLPAKMVTPDAETLKRIRAENAMIRRARATDTARTWFREGFVWPVHGTITGVYGSARILNGEPRQPHYGVDIAAPEGTPVRAPTPGRVVLAHSDMYFTGRTLILDHGHGLTSAFLHLDRLLVAEGEVVARGQPIATVGATGRVTGPHLDWRINLFSTRIDPALVAGPMPEADR